MFSLKFVEMGLCAMIETVLSLTATTIEQRTLWPAKPRSFMTNGRARGSHAPAGCSPAEARWQHVGAREALFPSADPNDGDAEASPTNPRQPTSIVSLGSSIFYCSRAVCTLFMLLCELFTNRSTLFLYFWTSLLSNFCSIHVLSHCLYALWLLTLVFFRGCLPSKLTKMVFVSNTSFFPNTLFSQTCCSKKES